MAYRKSILALLMIVLALPVHAQPAEGEGEGEGEGEIAQTCAPQCDVGCAAEPLKVQVEAGMTRVFGVLDELIGGYPVATTDFDSNGIVDIYHARLLDTVLGDPSLPAHCCVRVAWDINRPVAEDYVAQLNADPEGAIVVFIMGEELLLDLLTGLATVAEDATINAILSLLNEFDIGIPLPDLSQVDRSALPYIASDGDLDRDAVCNLGEYNGTLADIALFPAHAADPAITLDGGGCPVECPVYEDFGPGTEGEGEGEGEGEPTGCVGVCVRDWSMGCAAADPLPVENWWAGQGNTDVTFIAFGDCQTDSGAPDRNDLNALAINGVDQGAIWPAFRFPWLDEDLPVGQVRGVIMAGDITQHGRDGRYGTDDNIKEFTDVYGLCGNMILKFPIFEGYGNHDFFSYDHLGYRIPEDHPAADSVALRNPYRAGLENVAPGMDGHYSWTWDNIHFVQVNLCPSNVPASTGVPGDRDPRNALTFLENDLAENVRGKNKRVVIISHYGFYAGWDFNGWWTEDEAQAYLDVIAEYDVIAHIHGHAHSTQYYQWNGLDVFNVGSPYYATPRWNPDGRGRFTIFRITNEYLYAGDAGWNPANPAGDIQFPSRWAVTIPLAPMM